MGVTTPVLTGGGRAAPEPTAAVRAVRRPSQPWWTRLDVWAGALVVTACCVFVFVQLEPRLLFRDTTPAGGDTVAHVWWPAYLRDHLLPWRLTGWSPDFYAGFPAGQFYFPIPALLIVALDFLLPYNVAFKLVTALGPIALPAAAYVFGRGLRAPRPAPVAMAVGATAFLFFNGDPGTSPQALAIAGNQHIMGGNLASMLAGEFSFSLALAFALFFLGTFASTLRTGRRAWLPAALFAATVMSHFVVAIFAVVAALIIWLAGHPRRSFGRAATIGIVGSLLTAVWIVPLFSTFGYTTDTRYEAVTLWTDYLFPKYLWGLHGLLPWQWGATVLVGIVLCVAIWRRRTAYFVLVAIAAAMALLFRFWDDVQTTPAWNLRLVPFWYLLVFLIMAVGVAEAIRGAAALGARLYARRRATEDEDLVRAADAPTATAVAAALRERARRTPFVRRGVVAGLLMVLTIGFLVTVDHDKDFLPYWVRWNYSGLEDKGKADAEYRALVNAFRGLPPGRAIWEGNAELNVYGSTIALMLLPYWTDGRISSMEGVYYEASATSPYHFLTIASLMPSQSTSNPIRGLPYGTNSEFSTGVRRLQLLGVRYLALHTLEAKQAADADTRLTLVATSPDLDQRPPDSWRIYRVADSPIVQSLRYQPVAVDELPSGTAQSCTGTSARAQVLPRDELSSWECLAVPWFDDAKGLDRVITDGGPAGWQHSAPKRARRLPKETLPEVRVTHVRQTDDSVSFRVSRTGVPVLVKTSYFPNWQADGARGPYRSTPNFMVVIPTRHDVKLEYGTTTADWVGRIGTGVGLVGLIGLAWWPWWRRRRGGGPEGGIGQAAG